MDALTVSWQNLDSIVAGQSGQQTVGSSVQESDPDSSGLAQHAVVLGSGGSQTQDLRQGKELVFVSFKKGVIKDISPATISSWIKQTVILCYELSDLESITLHQVKAHDVRAFAASKAFQGGIFFTKSWQHATGSPTTPLPNTILRMLLGWTFHLGPVVAAQQIHH